MTRPTNEQLEQAQKLVAYDFESRRLDLPIHVAKAYERILAATAEPTDEELAEEATARFQHERSGLNARLLLREGYIEGARRTGAK